MTSADRNGPTEPAAGPGRMAGPTADQGWPTGPRAGGRRLAEPLAPATRVIGALLRTGLAWLLVGLAALTVWLWWSDPEPWVAWGSMGVAVHIGAPAYAIRGLGRALGRQRAGRAAVVAGWSLLILLDVLVLLLAAVVLWQLVGPAADLSEVVVTALLPAVAGSTLLVSLPRLWSLPIWWLAALSIALTLLALEIGRAHV